MSVTNGFLRISEKTLDEFRQNPDALAQRAKEYQSPDYLDMDKAGYELLFILDPSTADFENPEAQSPCPEISKLLAGGEPLHQDLDLGYGPAHLLTHDELGPILEQLQTVTFESMAQQAMRNVMLSELLMADLDETMLREYHWPYMESLKQFVAETIGTQYHLLRY